MSRFVSRARRAVVSASAILLSTVAAGTAIAQRPTGGSAQRPGGPASPGGSPAAMATDKKILNLGDYGRWNRITATAISNDGKWMSFAYTPNEGDATLHVKELD
ncbi:MAG TPA: hypothetical protein VG916_16125, partial [Gemmatimonadaceae bacterium]|nr:hypothetical protein [Gemmatimonadaceae bacterium]